MVLFRMLLNGVSVLLFALIYHRTIGGTPFECIVAGTLIAISFDIDLLTWDRRDRIFAEWRKKRNPP